MHSAHLLPADALSMLESESQDAFRSFAGDELDALDDTVDYDVLDTRIFSLGVLTDEDGIYIIVRCLVAGNRFAGSEIGEEIESSAESQIE